MFQQILIYFSYYISNIVLDIEDISVNKIDNNFCANFICTITRKKIDLKSPENIKKVI